MRLAFLAACFLFAAPYAHASEDERSFAFTLSGFSGDETSGIAVGVYSMRPDSIGWYVNATVSSLVDNDDDFRPIPGDIRVDSDTDSVTLNIGLTYALGAIAPMSGPVFRKSLNTDCTGHPRRRSGMRRAMTRRLT